MKKTAAAVISALLILSLAVGSFAASEPQTPSGIPFQKMEKFIDNYMHNYIGRTSPGAAVVVVKDGKILFSKGYGYADAEKKIPVDSKQTVFEYGSISKLFVYTVIMKLAEEGKIDLRADIRSYLPEGFLKKLKYDEPITMIDIMNHTTGFEDYLFDVILTTSKNRPSFEETLEKGQPRQVYRPGTVSAYSNYAVALAAYIAQRITGQKFHDYLTVNVINPLKMDSTSSHPELANKPGLKDRKANGYFPTPQGLKPGGWSYVPLYPIGGINGTAEDLARFAIAFMPEEGKVSPLFTKRATLDEMLTQTRPLGPEVPGFAHGFIEWDGGVRGVGHGGNTAYFSTQINMVPEERFGVIVMTNAAGEMDMTSGLTQRLIGVKNPVIGASAESLPDARVVEGSYTQARRMHSSFLEILGYMTMLKIRALDANKIEINMGGMTSTLAQTRPYVFERISAAGPLLKYNMGTIYFDVQNGRVQRMSGDFLPLTPGRTAPWLVVYMAVILISALYLVLTAVVLLWRKLFHRNSNTGTQQAQRLRKFHVLMVLCGLATLANNALLILRMIMNNYRSFSDVKIHVLLNYPLAALFAALSVLLLLNLKGAKLLKTQKVFYMATIVIIIAFIGTLINWHFFSVIS